MAKQIYLVRHCEAQGQPPQAKLTEKGLRQAEELAGFFASKEIDRIVSSPFLRAVQSITPFSTQSNLKIEEDDRLKERILSTGDLPDWLDKLNETFEDLDLKFVGGESSKEAMNRIVNVVEEVWKSEAENTIIVTHGNLMSLLLKHYDHKVGFNEWKKLSNPDVYLLNDQDGNVEWVWREETVRER